MNNVKDLVKIILSYCEKGLWDYHSSSQLVGNQTYNNYDNNNRDDDDDEDDKNVECGKREVWETWSNFNIYHSSKIYTSYNEFQKDETLLDRPFNYFRFKCDHLLNLEWNPKIRGFDLIKKYSKIKSDFIFLWSDDKFPDRAIVKINNEKEYHQMVKFLKDSRFMKLVFPQLDIHF
jgi:hypothetical protein